LLLWGKFLSWGVFKPTWTRLWGAVLWILTTSDATGFDGLGSGTFRGIMSESANSKLREEVKLLCIAMTCKECQGRGLGES
jgi:hypothetical protein